MMNLINEFDGGQRRFGPGHFDLIVIDEAHRSVYQKYRRIFEYFDGYLLGLTATPKDDVDFQHLSTVQPRNRCATDDYGLDEGNQRRLPRAAEGMACTAGLPGTQGIRYDDLSDEEKQRWESTDWGDDVDDDEFPTPSAPKPSSAGYSTQTPSTRSPKSDEPTATVCRWRRPAR